MAIAMSKSRKEINRDWYEKHGLEYHREYREKNRDKRRKWNRDWIKNNKDRYNASKYLYRDRLKLEVLTHYSKGKPKCAICGMDDIDCLVLDHINNDGADHRKAIRVSSRTTNGVSMHAALKREGFPEGLQVLCANCNTKKQIELCRKERLKNPVYKERVECDVDDTAAA